MEKSVYVLLQDGRPDGVYEDRDVAYQKAFDLLIEEVGIQDIVEMCGYDTSIRVEEAPYISEEPLF